MSFLLWTSEADDSALDLGDSFDVLDAFADVENVCPADRRAEFDALLSVPQNGEEEVELDWLASARQQAQQFLQEYGAGLSETSHNVLGRLANAADREVVEWALMSLDSTHLQEAIQPLYEANGGYTGEVYVQGSGRRRGYTLHYVNGKVVPKDEYEMTPHELKPPPEQGPMRIQYDEPVEHEQHAQTIANRHLLKLQNQRGLLNRRAAVFGRMAKVQDRLEREMDAAIEKAEQEASDKERLRQAEAQANATRPGAWQRLMANVRNGVIDAAANAKGGAELAKQVAVGNDEAIKKVDQKTKRAVSTTIKTASVLAHYARPALPYMQDLCRIAAVERGIPERVADENARWLSFGDVFYNWGVSSGVERILRAYLGAEKNDAMALAIGAVATLPLGEVGYLAYSMARNPLATLRAARMVTEYHLRKYPLLRAGLPPERLAQLRQAEYANHAGGLGGGLGGTLPAVAAYGGYDRRAAQKYGNPYRGAVNRDVEAVVEQNAMRPLPEPDGLFDREAPAQGDFKNSVEKVNAVLQKVDPQGKIDDQRYFILLSDALAHTTPKSRTVGFRLGGKAVNVVVSDARNVVREWMPDNAKPDFHEQQRMSQRQSLFRLAADHLVATMRISMPRGWEGYLEPYLRDIEEGYLKTDASDAHVWVQPPGVEQAMRLPRQDVETFLHLYNPIQSVRRLKETLDGYGVDSESPHGIGIRAWMLIKHAYTSADPSDRSDVLVNFPNYGQVSLPRDQVEDALRVSGALTTKV